MEDGEDFEWVKGKVPKRDKDGNEITNESLGSGGARRGDGTISAMAYDLEFLPDGGFARTDDDGRPLRVDAYGAEFPRSYAARELSPETQQWITELVEKVLEEIIFPLAKAAAPHVKSWLIESAAPAVSGKMRGIRRRLRPAGSLNDVHAASSNPAELNSGESTESSTGVAEVFDEPRISMTRAQWEEAFRVWSMTVAFEDALRRTLARADVVDDDDDDGVLGLQHEMEALTPQQRADFAQRMLESNPSLLDEAATKFDRIIGRGRPVDGKDVRFGLS